jgi:hypothetical protein
MEESKQDINEQLNRMSEMFKNLKLPDMGDLNKSIESLQNMKTQMDNPPIQTYRIILKTSSTKYVQEAATLLQLECDIKAVGELSIITVKGLVQDINGFLSSLYYIGDK